MDDFHQGKYQDVPQHNLGVDQLQVIKAMICHVVIPDLLAGERLGARLGIPR